jgi:hypothetical protein
MVPLLANQGCMRHRRVMQQCVFRPRSGKGRHRAPAAPRCRMRKQAEQLVSEPRAGLVAPDRGRILLAGG